MPRTLIDWDDRVLEELYRAHVKLKDIGEVLGISAKRVSDRARLLDLPKREPGTAIIKGKFAEDLYLNGMTIKEVAAALGSNGSSVRRVLISRGVKLRNFHARLKHDPTTVRAVRLRREGLDYNQIAERLKLTPCQVAHRVRSVLGARPYRRK